MIGRALYRSRNLLGAIMFEQHAPESILSYWPDLAHVKVGSSVPTLDTGGE